MNIGILGSGNIGGSLGRAWVAAGHAVKFGVRDTGKSEVKQLLNDLGSSASAASVAEAAAFGQVVVFAVPGRTMPDVVPAVAEHLAGKPVVDATNVNFSGTGPMSAMEVLAQHAPTAQVYRAFNTVGWENIRQPRYGGTPADLFFCGPDGPGRHTLAGLIADVGFRPMYVGGPEQTPLLDNVTRLWAALALGQGLGRRLGFRVLTAADDQAN